MVNPPIAIHRIDARGIAGAYYLQPDAADDIAGLGIPDDGKLVLAIGPEGGFTERDIHLLHTAGFRGLQVGPRILRTETAGIAVTAALQSHYGDW
jgi:16S rRNA (uracil1498-N3)-methyltransferase